MSSRVLPAIAALVLGSVSIVAAQRAAEPTTPTTLIENPQTRVLRVEILASSTRSMHSHPDMSWHVFVTMDAPIDLVIQGQTEPVKLGPWTSHFFKGGTVHEVRNPNAKPVQFLEFFSKKDAPAIP